MERDEEFALELQQQELALLNDSHIARNMQVIMNSAWLVSLCYLDCLQTTRHAMVHFAVRGLPSHAT